MWIYTSTSTGTTLALPNIILGSRDNSVSIVTRYWQDSRGSIPGRGKKFSSGLQRPNWPPIQWVPLQFPRGQSG
jgi:hypothetical protein